MSKKAIVIAGPTASGKSRLALELALQLNTQIINADSRQCFLEFGVAVAKPSREDLLQVQHFFVNSHSFTEHVSAATFAELAESSLSEIFKKSEYAIISGGTGMYLQAWMDGLSPLPQIDTQIRKQSQAIWESQGIIGLQEMLGKHEDPFLHNKESQNPARLRRALEVRLQTGQSILDFHKSSSTPQRNYDILSFALAPSREQLLENIETRTEQMMRNGLIAEAMRFYPYRKHKNLLTVGYREVYEGYDERAAESTIRENIMIHTRQYAKRQMTWYRNQGDYNLLNPQTALVDILDTLRK